LRWLARIPMEKRELGCAHAWRVNSRIEGSRSAGVCSAAERPSPVSRRNLSRRFAGRPENGITLGLHTKGSIRGAERTGTPDPAVCACVVRPTRCVALGMRQWVPRFSLQNFVKADHDRRASSNERYRPLSCRGGRAAPLSMADMPIRDGSRFQEKRASVVICRSCRLSSGATRGGRMPAISTGYALLAGSDRRWRCPGSWPCLGWGHNWEIAAFRTTPSCRMGTRRVGRFRSTATVSRNRW
jgi:hypothetical protein